MFTYAADIGIRTVGVYTDQLRFDDLMSVLTSSCTCYESNSVQPLCLSQAPIKMDTSSLLQELEGTLGHQCSELHSLCVGEDAAMVSKVEAVEFALEQNDEQLAKACLQDLGDIIKLSFASKVCHQQDMSQRIYCVLLHR